MPKYLDKAGFERFWNGVRERTIDDPYYDEITVKKYRDDEYETDYYIAYVPKYDSNGDIIPLSVSKNYYPDSDPVINDNPLVHAGKTGTTLSINGNATIAMTDNTFKVGVVICDGVVTDDYSFYDHSSEVVTPLVYEKYIGFTEDREVIDYDMNSQYSTSEKMLEDGCVNVFNGYFKIVENGVMMDLDNANPPVAWNSSVVTSDSTGMVMFMGVCDNGDLYFLTSDGRTEFNKGMSYVKAATILMGLDCQNIYYLDGGGSAAMVYRGSKLNRNWDEDQTKVRNIHYTIDFKKPSKNTILQRAYQQVGIEKQRIVEQLIPYINNVSSMVTMFLGKGDVIRSNTDLNDYCHFGKYYCPNKSVAQTLANTPLTGRGFTMFVIQVSQYDDGAIQIILTNHPTAFMFRIINPTADNPDADDPTTPEDEGAGAGVFRNWYHLPDRGPQFYAIDKLASQIVTYEQAYPRFTVVWSYSVDTSYGMDFLYAQNEGGTTVLHVVHIVPSTATGGATPNYTIDNDAHTLTIENTVSAIMHCIVDPAVIS